MSLFESAELGSEIPKDEYENALPDLRVGLLNAQFDLRKADFSVVVILMGDDRIGVEAVLGRLHEWMDARYLDTQTLGRPTQEESERPPFWRFWRTLPPDGRIGIQYGGWVLNPIALRLDGEIDEHELERRVAHMRRFEEELVEDGTLLLKFWIHLPKKELRKRLKRAKKDPREGWRVQEQDWQVYELYDEAMSISERLIRWTSTGEAPWQIVEGVDPRHRDLTVARGIRDALVARLAAPAPDRPAAPPVETPAAGAGALSSVDLAASVDPGKYKERLEKLQGRVHRLVGKAADRGLSSVLVFEGWDAAGKGGAIRRITNALPPALYRVVPIAAPTEEEQAHHYMWRFWRHLPRAGRMLVFDRSWYGRVLVERVEGFASEAEWRRAYEEINDFEEQLVEHGTPVLKFWLHLDPDEQLRRFKAREKTGYKKYKITDEDYRNRERWDEYVAAVDEMVARTSTSIAPWILVPANDKRVARLRVLEAVTEGLKGALERS